MYIACVWTRVNLSDDARPVFVVDTFEGTGAESICNRRQAIRLQTQFVILYKTLKCFHCCLRTQGLQYYTLSIKEALALLIVQIRKVQCTVYNVRCANLCFSKKCKIQRNVWKVTAHIMCKSEKCNVQPSVPTSPHLACAVYLHCTMHILCNVCTVYNVHCANLGRKVQCPSKCAGLTSPCLQSWLRPQSYRSLPIPRLQS